MLHLPLSCEERACFEAGMVTLPSVGVTVLSCFTMWGCFLKLLLLSFLLLVLLLLLLLPPPLLAWTLLLHGRNSEMHRSLARPTLGNSEAATSGSGVPQPKKPKSISAVTAHLLGAWLCQVGAWDFCGWPFVFSQALERVFEHPSRNVASRSAACTIPGKHQTPSLHPPL